MNDTTNIMYSTELEEISAELVSGKVMLLVKKLVAKAYEDGYDDGYDSCAAHNGLETADI